jgi:hypothetical protein
MAAGPTWQATPGGQCAQQLPAGIRCARKATFFVKLVWRSEPAEVHGYCSKHRRGKDDWEHYVGPDIDALRRVERVGPQLVRARRKRPAKLRSGD